MININSRFGPDRIELNSFASPVSPILTTLEEVDSINYSINEGKLGERSAAGPQAMRY